LVQAKEEAEKASRLKSAMLANMSHEVRSPLTPIIGFANVLVDAGLDDPYDRFARHIRDGGERLLETLDAMLDLSKLEAGAATLNVETVSVGAVAGDVAAEHADPARDAGLEMRVETPDAPVTVNTDDNALRRVLTNVVRNAVKFTPSGGVVTVRVAPDPSSGTGSGRGAVIEVEDTGVGMDPAFARERAARPFQQESVGAGREYEGSGLGLAIVDHYVRLMGGTYSIETAKGEGTRVTVRLPHSPADES
jgi:signal transduction histidine kinase